LIRQAAENEDVQINFGVVLNEAMADAVKITVIATGFERQHLPVIERKEAPAVAVPSRPALRQEPEAIDVVAAPVVAAVAGPPPPPPPAAPEPERAVFPEPFFEPRVAMAEPPAPAEPPMAPPRSIPNWGRFEPVMEPEDGEDERPVAPQPIPITVRQAPPAPAPVQPALAMEPEPAPAPAAQAPAGPPAKDDLEIPAFLRRERKLFQ
jgi:hypothetical protein